MADWTTDKTIAVPTIIKIEYVNQAGQSKSVELQSTVISTSTTTYGSYAYFDAEGKEQVEEVALSRIVETRTTAAAVNGALVKYNLENNLGLPSGDALQITETYYDYVATVNGFFCVRDTTFEYISGYELAGSLNITDYKDVLVSSDLILKSKSINEYVEFTRLDGRTYNKTATTRYLALGLTQEGSQSASKQLANESGTGAITNSVLSAMSALICEGIEVRTSVGKLPIQARPSEADLVADELENPVDYDFNPDDIGSGETSNSSRGYDSSDAKTFTLTTLGPDQAPSKIDTVKLPYAPDDTFQYGDWRDYAVGTLPDGRPLWAQFVPEGEDWKGYLQVVNGVPLWASLVPGGNIGGLLPSNVKLAAKEYAEMMNGLKVGQAYGFNVTTSADQLPSEPFSSLFINAAGISVAAKVNGISWAFDSSGLVASADMTLCGVAGKTASPSSSWVRLPVSIAELPALSSPSTNANSKPANTVTVAADVDLNNTTSIFSQLPKTGLDTPSKTQSVNNVVAPFNITQPINASSRTQLKIIKYNYALLAEDDLELITKSQLVCAPTEYIEIPAATLIIQGLPPQTQSTDQNIDIPAALIELVAITPVPFVDAPLE